MATYDVSFSLGYQPRWPDACICCGNPSQGGWSKAAVGIDLTGNIDTTQIVVPMCTACDRRWRYRAIFWLVPTVAGAWTIYRMAGSLNRMFEAPLPEKFASGLASVAFFVLVVVVVVVYMGSTPLRIRQTGNTVFYRFRSPEYGASFARMNGYNDYNLPG